ncbi:MAG: methyltransferase [Deltaproteobacteria bacterium]
MNKNPWNPGRLLETSGSYWQACALHAGVRLEVFSLIGNDQLRVEDMARISGANARGLKMLLNALTAMGLLIKCDDLYGNTSEAKTFLVKGSAEYIGHIIMHHHHLVHAWAQLPQAVVTGRPVRQRFSFGEGQERESFLMGMFNLAMLIAPELVHQVDLEGRHHFLDLGGGPGTYAIHFCLANPSLRATVYDLPTTRPFALKTIDRFDLRDRINFLAGDYAEGDVTGTYDVVWLSHILHGESPEACQRLITKAVSVLEPGGLILVHDFILDNAFDGPLFPALFSLNMLINTEDGQSYSEAQITEMLNNAGVKGIRRMPFRGPNDSGIIFGTVSG